MTTKLTKVTADTNVLIRVIVGDDPDQAAAAAKALSSASLVAISLQSLCEVAWVLQRSYEVARSDIADAIQALIDTQHVVVNRPAVEMGLAVLKAGGDFADGVIAFDGAYLGGEAFISFDKKAVQIMQRLSHPSLLL